MSTEVVQRSRTAYENLSDEQIVTLFQAGDSDAQDFLIQKYAKFVRKKVPIGIDPSNTFSHSIWFCFLEQNNI